MQEDRITWNTLKTFCKFKLQSKTQVFCKNEYNVTGLCAEKYCPLANSRYATVREENGICYLYVKTVERSHFLNKLWEKVKLSRKLDRAKQQIRQELMYWPRGMVLKCLNRMVKINQYLNRTRKLRLTSNIQTELIPIRRKIERREKRKEFKALKAANIETNIEKELIQRLKNGMYEELYSFPISAFDKAVNDPKRELMDPAEYEAREEDISDSETVREFVMDSEMEESDFDADAISDIEDINLELSQLGDWKADLEKQKLLNDHEEPSAIALQSDDQEESELLKNKYKTKSKMQSKSYKSFKSPKLRDATRDVDSNKDQQRLKAMRKKVLLPLVAAHQTQIAASTAQASKRIAQKMKM